ncbi:SNARE associated Golgi protein [Corchorus olitorius]|uniref:SNARE associated Golgi protein n=1 Tax=Corchorus olitorius TaxID=93759 RepID=A0A1R3IS85_9ROSI|nr:SNARE associated Golgi protein [Corchorus olitorius]
MAFTWGSALRITLLILLIAAVVFACFTLPVEKVSAFWNNLLPRVVNSEPNGIPVLLSFPNAKVGYHCYNLFADERMFSLQILKDFLLWVEKDLGPWGPLVLAVAYIPLTVLAVPASVLTLGGGYLFGLPVGFVADSIGATVGAGAAFLLGRTIGRSFVVSRLKDYPQFRSVAIAIRKSGFKIVLLLRLVPLLPFNMLNYLLSVTPVSIGEYMLASWLGMMPITLALVYVGTTLKDLSDVTHGWSEFSTTRWAFLILGLVVSVILMVCVTKVAKSALEKALAENEDVDSIIGSPQLPIVGETPVDLHQPLIIKIDSPEDTHEK